MNDVSHTIVRRNKVATSMLAALMIHGRKGKAGIAPDFDWLAGMLSYVDEIVIRQHYRDEETWLLKPIERQMPELRPRLARMRRDHIGSAGYCVRMAEALTHWKRGWPNAIDHFIDNARDCYRLSASHGQLLRKSALPAAERCFAAAQWQSASTALAHSTDSVSVSRDRTEAEAALCRRMGRSTPPPSPSRIGTERERSTPAKHALEHAARQV